MSYREEVAAWVEGVIAGYDGGVTALAKAARLQRSTIYDLRNKVSDASEDVLAAIATAAGVPVPRRTITVEPPATAPEIAQRIADEARRLADLLTTLPAAGAPDLETARKVAEKARGTRSDGGDTRHKGTG